MSGIWTIQENKRRKAAVNNVVEVIGMMDATRPFRPPFLVVLLNQHGCGTYYMYSVVLSAYVLDIHNTTIPTYERTEYDTSVPFSRYY